MKLIKPSFTILHQAPGLEGIYKQIELAGRTCYKSEDKITPDSAKAFVDRMIASGHGAMLEHGTVYLKAEGTDLLYNKLMNKYSQNPYSKVGFTLAEDKVLTYITTNLRVLVENGWTDDLQYICEPTKYHEKRVCVKFICDRGVSHEFVRHRVFSFAQESTRYVGSSSMKPITEFDCNNSSDICEAYKQGFSMKNISDNSSLSECQVRKILIDNNIEIRGLNNKGNRIEDYFYNIDTPEKAYLLGIIQTDGSVRLSNENAALTITQHKDYAWYIETMLLNFSDKICTTKDRNCLQMLIGSKSIVNDLINCGIVPNKTKLQTNEDVIRLWEVVPEEFKGDFIRGCIDGDGHVTFFTQKGATNESCNIGFCSIKELLIDKIIELIFDKFNYRCGKGKDGNIYKLWITDYKKAMEIGRFIFQNFQYPFGHPKKASTWIERLGCNYQIADYKDPKFQIIEPTWLSESSPQSIFTFMNALNYSEDAYSKLRLGGWKPQEARAILPNALKTELVMTGFTSDWQHFFELRCASNAHPQARELAIPLYDEFINHKLI
ncbi:MAG: FAD-dependent thymidylate synthase [Phocaeicola massiliensis]